MNGFYWLASYPKSGNTWLRLFLESLAAGGIRPDINKANMCSHAASREIFDRIFDVSSSDLTQDEITDARPPMYEILANEADAPLFMKVHDAWMLTPSGMPLFPPELTLGAVVIVRDPRDVAVSFAHHGSKSVDFSIERMGNPLATTEMSGRRLPEKLPQRLSSWSMHVESWLAAPIGVLPLKYEDMLDNPTDSFGKAARFLGLDFTPDELSAAIEAVRFDRLRDAEETEGFRERMPGTARFFRRGVAGGWRDSLTPAQIARIETEHGPMMRKLGYL
jgi:hypothetical protein